MNAHRHPLHSPGAMPGSLLHRRLPNGQWQIWACRAYEWQNTPIGPEEHWQDAQTTFSATWAEPQQEQQ